mmetsp:Transcript_17797/g.46682  ORF Transcript_17797/g.46682 Transcript_17797/m.46682 type:complete len:285 (-) Transcript_17797:593-1447(-)
MHEYSSDPFWAMMAALMTSFLWMGPTVAPETGMGGRSLPCRSFPGFRRNSRRASKAPRVEACTVTPFASVANVSLKLAMSFMHSSFRSSTSSSWCMTRIPVPGTTFVNSGSPVIFRPMAPSSDSCFINSDLTLVSRDGGGVSNARAVVTIGPSCVHRTIVSPACRQPLTSITSSVAPRPSTTFTSRTVHWRLYPNMSFAASLCCVRDKTTLNRSGTPSPVMADVGTTETVEPGSSLSQYRATFKLCSLSSVNAFTFFCSNSSSVFWACFDNASLMDAPSVGLQS